MNNKTFINSKIFILYFIIALFTFMQVNLTAQSTGICGDANEDGILTIVDPLIIAQYYVEIHPGPPTVYWDWNGDGDVNILDALCLAQQLVGLCQGNCSDDTNTPEPGINYPPDAIDDLIFIEANSTIDIYPLANDKDVNGDIITITDITMPINGSAELIEDKITYNPNPDYIGTDIINYSITDGNGGEDTGKMIIRVNPEAGRAAPYPLDTSTTFPGAVWPVPYMQSVPSGTGFAIELHLNSGNQYFAGYHIEITWDPSIIEFSSIAAGADGFLSSYNGNTPVNGILKHVGFDVEGKEPGTDLHIVIYGFTALQTGITDINIKIRDIIDSSYQEIGNPTAFCGRVFVDLPIQTTTPTPELSPDPTPTPTPDDLTGDANDDGVVNIIDALITAQYYVGLLSTLPALNNADTNCDGVVNIIDALLIAQYYVGIITEFC